MIKNKDGKQSKGTVVEIRGDDFNRGLRLFSKKIQDSGILKEVRDRMAYEKPADARQRLKKQARKRWERAVEDMITRGQWHKDKNY